MGILRVMAFSALLMKLTTDEINKARQLLKDSGCSAWLNPSMGYDEMLYRDVLSISDNCGDDKSTMTEQIKQKYDYWQQQADEKWDDLQDERRISEKIQRDLGIW